MTGRVAQMLENNRDYIIAEFSGTNGPARTVKSLAEEFNVSEYWLKAQMRIWRRKGLVGVKRGRLDEDRELIEPLYRCGFTPYELAEKFGATRQAIIAALKRWGVYVEEQELRPGSFPKISLSDLKFQWADIAEQMTVTVNRRPMFYLVPIRREEV